MPDTKRLSWVFLKNPSIIDTNTRQANALEYIAYYLDRIDQNIARIADTLTEDPTAPNFTVLSALKDVAEAVKTQE
jgi:hypothetical protein